ncbi:MerR family transcriptional regulator [Actinomadura craniellae]|uniref:MerR family transcriptional regulator n=1 Tax=Actinomadura craniellae TaxID=2231787 RepID=A0A365H8C4_9ACTN|nr:MerR family transcriptional regulator [Actinomadura craniellae]RAY15374.1 MerR family transcriptional regulator [Actinomadura craniellae]
MESETWTITELAERAGAVLADEPAEVNGRVRDLPNERLIRWYTTIGLVDPPLGRRGRVALYGRRHLLQLVAIKRRQAAGRSIAEIQLELAGAPDTALGEIAGLPGPGSEERDDRFWAARPAADIAFRPAVVAEVTAPVTVPALRLAPGVTLVLDGLALTPTDLAAIGAAARPLIDALLDRGLIPHSADDVPGRHP